MRLDFVEGKRQDGRRHMIEIILEFNEVDSVMVRIYTSSETKWTKGYVVDRLGKLHYTVRVDSKNLKT